MEQSSVYIINVINHMASATIVCKSNAKAKHDLVLVSYINIKQGQVSYHLHRSDLIIAN